MMKLTDARRKIMRTRLIAVAVMAVCSLFIFIGLLKSIYLTFSGLATEVPLARGIQHVIAAIYDMTRWLAPVWTHAPAPDLTRMHARENYQFIVLVCFFLIGVVLWQSTRPLQAQVRETLSKAALPGVR